MTSGGARLFRALAVAIAVLALLDPAVTSERRVDAVVSVVPGDAAADGALAQRVARELDGRFRVVPAPLPGAAATVVVGDRLPRWDEEPVGPVFAVVPARDGPWVALQGLEAPRRALVDGEVPVRARFRVQGAAGRSLFAELEWEGVVADRRHVVVGLDDEAVEVTLTTVPGRTGPMSLQVRAGFEDVPGAGAPGGPEGVVVEVVDARWRVFFFDPRPSWMSTFVRRALDDDPRFDVSARIVTSPGLGTEIGAPPAGLTGPGALAGLDVVVVGAPEGLTAPQVAGLEAFLRQRGGSVVLLLDRMERPAMGFAGAGPSPGPYQDLLGVQEWRGWEATEALVPSPTDPADAADLPPPLRAMTGVSPVTLPPAARPLLEVVPGGATRVALGAEVPGIVVWRRPVGPGRLVVSGALDAWQHRDPEVAGFDGFWQGAVAEAAAAALEPMEIRWEGDRGLARPGAEVGLHVALREVAPLEGERVEGPPVRAWLEGADGRELRLWPGATPGRLEGRLPAPVNQGAYRLVVEAGEVAAETYLAVEPWARDAGVVPDPELLAAWVAGRGGVVRGEGELTGLARALDAAVGPERRRERWHPMRSAWWILPFVLALGGEWWWRRRHGLR